MPQLSETEVELARLRATQWPDEATAEMKDAVYALNLGRNHLSEDDVIDIYDTFRKIVMSRYEQKPRGETNETV